MQGEDDWLFSCRASKSPKPLWNYFRPHHWCFPLISFKQIFFQVSVLIASGYIFSGLANPGLCERPRKTEALTPSWLLAPLGGTCTPPVKKAILSAPVKRNCYFLIWMLKWHQVRQQTLPDGEVKTAQSHLQDSKPHQLFVSFSVRVPAVNHLLVTEDTISEKGARYQWDQSFHPLPKPRWLWPRPRWSQYVWRGRTDSPLKPGALTDLLPHPPKQQGEGSISPPTPTLQASLLLLCRPPVPHISPRHETPNEIMKSSGVCGAQLKVTAACEFTFKNN